MTSQLRTQNCSITQAWRDLEASPTASQGLLSAPAPGSLAAEVLPGWSALPVSACEVKDFAFRLLPSCEVAVGHALKCHLLLLCGSVCRLAVDVLCLFLQIIDRDASREGSLDRPCTARSCTCTCPSGSVGDSYRSF